MASVQKVQSTHGHHGYSDEERDSFVEHINNQLKNDPHLKGVIPIHPKDALFQACTDGILLTKLINDAVPDTIDERVLNIPAKNVYQITENNNLVINSAKAIGCSVVNIGWEDIKTGSPYLLLGLIWQIIRIGLLSKISLTNHPELFRLLEEGEEISDLLKLPPEKILLRWFNYHLKNAGHPKKVNNFGSDIKDSEAYTVLLNQLAPSQCSKAPLNQSDLTKRAEMLLENANKLDARKFVTAKDIVAGNPKLNLAFIANLFNTHPGLEPLSEAEKAALEEWLFASEGSREARVFALWINSLGIEPFVTNLFSDVGDGLIILKTLDVISPGIVDWSKVNTKEPLNKFKKVENCNYAVVLGKQLKFSLVGIGGTDIVDGNQTLILALVWQMMRFHVLSILKGLGGKTGKEINDQDIINWANDTAKAGGRSISGFKDSHLRNSLFLLDVLAGVRPGSLNPELITPGESDKDATQNAKYAISIARKFGATIFLLPEDIVDVKPKMILTFLGSIMAIHIGSKAAGGQ